MVDVIHRPLFFEGQVLAAQDLSSAVDYARGRAQRHDGQLHTTGVASGLSLVEAKHDGTAFVSVSLTKGVAIDPTGREIVVSEDQRLDPELFSESNVALDSQPDAWYPVVVRYQEQAETTATLIGGCGSSGGEPNRMSESGVQEFRRPGGAADLGEEDPAVLVGFVRWGGDSVGQFAAVETTDGHDRVRYVGVRADSVEAQGGRLQIRTQAESRPGATALHLTHDDLTFGLQDGSGGLSELFNVNRKGEVTAAGKPLGGGVRVESGIASDLTRIPLPANVTEAAIADGSVTLHVQVQPLLAAPSGYDIVIPLECYVDADRRLHCRALFLSVTGSWRTSKGAHVARYTAIGVSSKTT